MAFPLLQLVTQINKEMLSFIPYVSFLSRLSFFCICAALWDWKSFVCWWGDWLKLSGCLWLRCCSVSAWRLLRFIRTDQSERSAATLTSSPSSFDCLFWRARAPQRSDCERRTPQNGSVLPTNDAVIVVLFLWFTNSTGNCSRWQINL